LPQMPGRAAAGVNIAGITPMQFAERAAQAVLIGRREHDVDVIELRLGMEVRCVACGGDSGV
jgi:hypothetical protein